MAKSGKLNNQPALLPLFETPVEPEPTRPLPEIHLGMQVWWKWEHNILTVKERGEAGMFWWCEWPRGKVRGTWVPVQELNPIERSTTA
ncbi:hypothetical protein [Deinococcus misasensis]|uniref:hypothetical protein n=1 Tax=Deinococcus misasensis TaxID=392413 RepID=UPI000555668F|nr:hypothetical protein [Deinococcus misasensis]